VAPLAHAQKTLEVEAPRRTTIVAPQPPDCGGASANETTSAIDASVRRTAAR
jgi:hypothetical protein